jgi:hypothetical protein
MNMIRSLNAVTLLILLVAVAAPHVYAQPSEVLSLEGTRLDVDVHGNIYVLDSRQGTLSQYDRTMRRQAMTGGPGWEQGQFDQPAGIWAKNGLDVYVADYGNHRIQRFDRTLSFISALSTRDAEDASTRFGYPTDVTVSRLGALFICDSENSRIVKVDVANRVESSFGGFGGGAGRLRHPVQVEIGPHDAVYVLDPPRVVMFDNFGNYLATIGEDLKDPQIAADDKGVIVVDGLQLVCFTKSQRPLPAVSIATLIDTPVESVSRSPGGSGSISSDGRLYVVADPRSHVRRRAMKTILSSMVTISGKDESWQRALTK